MDYLDPKKKREHRKRLFVGYALMAVAIAFATVILVYIGSGFYVDKQTGDLIQNGQIFVNSDPEGAQVFVNNKLQKTKTAGKLVLPSGTYSVKMQKEGYRDWVQQLALEGGRVQRLDYARLIPKELKTSIVQTFASAPVDISQSPDRRWLTYTFADQPYTLYIYDLTKPDQAPKPIAVDPALYTDTKKIGSLYVNEWSEDNKTMLVENRLNSTAQDYFIVNRDDATQTKNLSKLYGSVGVAMSLIERSNDRVFVFNPTTKILQTASINSPELTNRLTDVIEFKALNENTIVYTTQLGASQAKVAARLTDGTDKSYVIRELPLDSPRLLSISKFGASTVLAVGATSDNKVAIYKNPIGYLKANPTKNLPLATTIFSLDAPTEVSFSTDSSVVMARGKQRIVSHYFDEDKSAKFDIAQPLDIQKLRWTDGKHLQYVSGGFAYMIDYDGANVEKLVETNSLFSVTFDNNYRYLYSFSQSSKPFNVSRTQIKLND